jgi:hypothetical protein
MCGENRDDALHWLDKLEHATSNLSQAIQN